MRATGSLGPDESAGSTDGRTDKRIGGRIREGMVMSKERDEMNRALKDIVVPQLRQRGFKGSFPHFRRVGEAKIDLLTFQFDRHGGGFVIEISKCSPDGTTTAWGEHIPASKISACDMHSDERLRLKPCSGGSTDDWFRYDKKPLISSGSVYEKIAKSVLAYLDKAERWWAEDSV